VATGVVGAAAYRGVTGAEAEPGPIPPGPVGNGAVVLSALSQSVSTSSGRSAGTLTLDISTSHDVGSVGAEQHGDQSPLPSVGMPTPLSERYVLGNLLGRGGYASVRQAVHRETGEVVAVKVLQRKVKPAVEAAIRRETSFYLSFYRPRTKSSRTYANWFPKTLHFLVYLTRYWFILPATPIS